MKMKRWHHITWKSALSVVVALVLVLAAAAGLFRAFAPLVPTYRAEAQAWASRVLDRPVEIASMGARLGLVGPELTLGHVAILSRDGRHVVIEARELRLGLSLRAMLHGQFSRPSRIVLIQPQLVLERETDGSYTLRDLEGSLNPGARKTDWRTTAAEAFAQDAALRVRGGQVTLMDMRNPAAPLVFSNLQINLDNSRDDHRLSGRVQLPAPLGRSLSFSTQVQGAGLEPAAWQWQAEVQGDSLNLPQWLEYWPAARGRIRSGNVSVRTALTGVGTRVDQVEGSVSARAIVPANAASGLDMLAGSVIWTRTASGWTLAGRDWQLRRGADVWPASQFDLRFARAAPDSTSWSGDASFLRLQDVTLLSTWLPADFAVATARLQKLSPSGDLKDVQFAAQRSGGAFGPWALGGQFDSLGLHADGDIPGFSGLNGTVNANQDGGTLALAGTNATVDFAHLFRGPLTATSLKADLQFHHDAQGWMFTLKDLAVANRDVQQATAAGTLLLPADGGSPVIDLQASVANADAGSKSTYLPVGIMPKEVVAWLDSAIVGGQAPTASLILRGKLADFPYDREPGLFDIRFHLIHGELDYADGWPPVKDLDADVEFKNQGMFVTVRQGTLLGDQVGGTTADFADLRNGRLHIQGEARGDAAAALAFLRNGPLQKRFGHVLDGLSATGDADVTLNLLLPVERVDNYRLDGRVQLRNVGIRLAALPHWPVSGLHGAVRITQDGVGAERLQAIFLGQPLSVRLSPGTHANTTRLTVAGGAQAGQLATMLPAAFKPALSGATVWRLSGALPNKPAESSTGLSLTLQSDLQGLALDLPPPFAKTADAAVPLQTVLNFDGNELNLRLAYGTVMRGVYRLHDVNGAWRFDRGDLVFGGAPPVLPAAPGLMIGGELPELSLAAWKKFATSGPAAVPVAPVLPPWLGGADLTIGQFAGFDQHVQNLHLGIARAADHWTLALVSQPLAGTINWPFKPDAQHPISADMQRVTLVRKPPAGETAQPTSNFDPRDIPPLQIDIKQFRYNDIALDNLHVELEPQAEGVNLKSLTVASPGLELHASGQWTGQPDAGTHTVLDVQLQSHDIKQTLQAFGFAPGISGSRGEMQAELNWPGGPLGEILPVLNGKLHIKLQNGSLLELKPGAGRVFGLLSINALPRRLLLNFSDVLGKGFAYDSIEGTFTIQNGDAYTTDLTVSGPAAKIHLVGRTGLVKHDFDEAVVVLPSVGSTLPLIGALAGGVGVGAVVFLLTEIFKKPLSAVGEARYHLSGTWDNPKLTAVAPPKPAPAKP
ncbi:MAG: TIGR02099 family protein [Gammaproteobacteria bacterium]|nr:TIGR02099 family protein [Gammaproteobacteria bacterium]